MRRNRIVFLGLMIGAFLFSGCERQPASLPIPAWAAGEVRQLDPADAPSPELDLLAVYSRHSSNSLAANELVLRLDFLDLNTVPGQDIYLALDFLPGPAVLTSAWDGSVLGWEALFYLPSRGEARFLGQDGAPLEGFSASAYRDPQMDSLTVRITGLPISPDYPGFRMQVIVAAPGSRDIADASAPFEVMGLPPRPAPVGFVFWNTFPADTPVQALRRWDGAHTGPYGGRHGLYNLLKTARAMNLPLTLLDVKSPGSLASLEASQGLALVREMEAAGLLTLPAAAPVFPVEKPLDVPVWALARSVLGSELLAREYGLRSTQTLFLPQVSSSSGFPTHRLVFTPFPQGATPMGILTRYQGKRILGFPVPALDQPSPEQATPNGPSLELRRQMASFAYQANEEPESPGAGVFMLGGDLVSSSWGDPLSSRVSLRYLLAHPWLQVVDLATLAAENTPESARFFAQEAMPLTSRQETNLAWLSAAADSPLAQVGWQVFTRLLAPSGTRAEDLVALRDEYWLALDDLRNLDGWIQNHGPTSGCYDLDGEAGLPRCALINDRLLLLIDPRQGSILFAIDYTNGEAIPFIAPSSLLSSGQSDPSSWRLQAGYASDPAVFPGAFVDDGENYSWELVENQLVLTGGGAIESKSITLLPYGFVVRYQTRNPVLVQVPLSLGATLPPHPDWARSYRSTAEPHQLAWQYRDLTTLQVRSSGKLSISSFLEGLPALGATEDPNAEKPPGAYLPLPIALVESLGEGVIEIEVLVLR